MKNIDSKKLFIASTNKDLCTRCGTCMGVCPMGAISLDKSFYPILNSDKCQGCELCAKVCPGDGVNFEDLTEITFGYRNDSISSIGYVSSNYIGYARDRKIREGGASGGAITALLTGMLEKGLVEGCIVARMNKEKPWIGEYFIAHTVEDLLDSQDSLYTSIPVNVSFKRICNLPGKYAYVALPCQVQGYRMAAEKIPILKEKIHFVIGLFCGGSLEPYAVNEMLQAKGLNSSDICNFQFRSGKWPGKIRAILKSGEIVNMHYFDYKDGAYNYLIRLYMPKRCQTCIDSSNEFADISFGDVWLRDKDGRYQFSDHSTIVVQTSRGSQVLKEVCESGNLIAREFKNDSIYKVQLKRKGIIAPLRIARLLGKGKQVPVYDRPAPKAGTKERLTERMESFMLWVGQYKFFRYPIMKFVTSIYSYPLIKLSLYIKRKKY